MFFSTNPYNASLFAIGGGCSQPIYSPKQRAYGSIRTQQHHNACQASKARYLERTTQNTQKIAMERTQVQQNPVPLTKRIYKDPARHNIAIRQMAVAQIQNAIAHRLSYPTIHGLLATHWENGTITKCELFQLFSTQAFDWERHLNHYISTIRRMQLDHMRVVRWEF